LKVSVLILVFYIDILSRLLY